MSAGKMNLRPFERRLLVGVLVVLLLVVNFLFIWPHFGDWAKAQDQLDKANGDINKFQTAIAQKGDYEQKVKDLESAGAIILAEDQANQFLRTVNNQGASSGVIILNNGRAATSTNEFFLEVKQTFSVQATDEQLVDFLYQLGSGNSMIRARGLSLRPNPPRQQLSGNIDLVASYQKNSSRPAPAAAPAPTATAKKP
ncbi:MAG TPA: hypothetical protein VL527_13210 [Dongiaceae bacterium]|nr:hypothetical protein [Dongiaceae bacterium]